MKIALARCSTQFEAQADDAQYVRALVERGAEVHCPAWTDPTVDWSSFDVVQLRSTWDYHERPDAFAEWVRHVDAVSQLFNRRNVVEWNLDKRYLRALSAAGVPVVPTHWVEADVELQDAALAEVVASLGGRAMWKPAIGADSFGAVPVSPDTVSQVARDAPRGVVYMLQPYLTSVETEGEVSVIVFDGTPSHAVRKRPQVGDFRVQDNHGGTDAPEPLTPELEALAARTLAAVPGSTPLVARVDLMFDDAGRYLLGELELIEPSLFFVHSPRAAQRLADALWARVAG